MRPIEFDDSNVIMAKDQSEYLPLPAHKDAEGVVTSCWILTGEEIQRVSETGIIWLQVSTFNHPLQPVMLSVQQPKLGDTPALGPTGEHPDGKLCEHDQGEIRFAVARDGDKVLINFGTPVTSIGFDLDHAIEFSKILMRKATEA